MSIITISMKLIPSPFVVSSRYRIYAQKVDSEKNCYRNTQLLGGFASFPGAREVSSISGSLPDDPGGITCMNVFLLHIRHHLGRGNNGWAITGVANMQKEATFHERKVSIGNGRF